MLNKDSAQTLRAFLIALCIIPISALSVKLYSPSLPQIAVYFHASRVVVQYTMTSFFLGFAIGSLPFGIISDSWGRKKPLLIGVLLFLIASIISAFSTSITMLLVMRFFQGLGAGAPSVIAFCLVTDSSEGLLLKKRLSILAATWSITAILSPWVGGYIQVYLGWRGVFYFFTAVGLIYFIICSAFLKETKKEFVPFKVDVLWSYFKILLCDRAYLACMVTLGVTYMMIIAFSVIGPFLIQQTLGFNAVVFGRLSLILGVVIFAATLLNRELVKYFKVSTLLKSMISLLFFVTVAQVIISYSVQLAVWTIMLPVAFIVFFAAIGHISTTIIVLTRHPKITGIVNAISSFSCLFIVTVLTAAIGQVSVASQRMYAWFYIALAAILVGAFVVVSKNVSSE